MHIVILTFLILSQWSFGVKCLTSTKIIHYGKQLCFCAPISDATLESLFSHINLMKTTVRNRLINGSLNSILRIRVSGISMQTFHNNYVDKCIQYWYNTKNRRR